MLIKKDFVFDKVEPQRLDFVQLEQCAFFLQKKGQSPGADFVELLSRTLAVQIM
jgi:hypothetical protein